MSARAFLLAILMLIGLGLIVTGVALWSTPSAFIVAGVGVIAFGVLVLSEVA